MFGKRRTPGSGGSSPGDEGPQLRAEGESRPDPRGETRESRVEARSPAGSIPLRGRAASDPARRPLDAMAARRKEARSDGDPASNSGRKLVVGHGIRLSGEIKKCETLVVEGHIEADLNDCASLEISDGGEFQGAAVVEAAEISGYFEGELTVKGRLLLHASGLVRGRIRYADLEIERGGRLAGDVDVIGHAAGEGHLAEQAELADYPAEDYDASDAEDAGLRQAAGGEKPGALL